MLEINVRLFGAFRDFSGNPAVRLECAEGTSIAELRMKMQAELEYLKPGTNASGLLQQSVFADERTVLGEEYRLERSQELAIIPPVCGG